MLWPARRAAQPGLPLIPHPTLSIHLHAARPPPPTHALQTPPNCSAFFPAPMLGLMRPGPVPLPGAGESAVELAGNTTSKCASFFESIEVRALAGLSAAAGCF